MPKLGMSFVRTYQKIFVEKVKPIAGQPATATLTSKEGGFLGMFQRTHNSTVSIATNEFYEGQSIQVDIDVDNSSS